jgi:hypothetical protein
MRSTNYFEMLLQDPDRAIAQLLQQGVPAMLLVGAGLLAAFGVVLAGQALFRGNSARPSVRGVAQNIGASAWLLPIAAVFGLYVLWMRPSLTTPDETAPVTIPVVAQVDKPDPVETDTKLPDWAKATEHSIGDTQLVVVTGEIGATVDEAVAAGRIAVVERLRSDFSAVHPQSAGWEPPASIAGDAIRRSFVEKVDRKTVSSGTPFSVYRAYEQVEISPAVRKKILPLWRNQIVEKRIWALGGLAGLLTLTFGTLAAYFRLDQRTAGVYRRRLKLAAVSVIAAGGMAAATML